MMFYPYSIPLRRARNQNSSSPLCWGFKTAKSQSAAADMNLGLRV